MQSDQHRAGGEEEARELAEVTGCLTRSVEVPRFSGKSGEDVRLRSAGLQCTF